jgi:adenylosuccinate synthase
MVIDPEALFAELKMLEDRGIDWQGRVFISDRAHLVLPHYRAIDRERDEKRRRPIGTTGRGIGIAYSMKSDRDGIRIADLDWQEKLDELDREDLDFLSQYTERLRGMKIDIAAAMWTYRYKDVLMEGAQGAMLDIDSGTYPYVSSGLSAACGASAGTGVGPRSIDRVIGVCKAYTTRVGNGPLPTEFDEATQSELYTFVRDTGREYGVTTGRPRRCGYLDLVALRYACRVNSVSCLALTHLDVYDTLNEVEVCTAYDIDGSEVVYFPSSIPALNAAKPRLQKFAGWKTSLTNCRSYEDLPIQAREYIRFIESFTGTPVTLISVGYEREQTFIRYRPWD